MNTTTTSFADSTTSSPVTSAPAAVSASAETSAPAWTEAYFAELDRSCNTAAAAFAAGIPLPVVIRHRRSDPAFATRENDVLSAIPELLLCEALRRALQRAADAEASAKDASTSRRPQPRFGSDALLLKLIRHWIPGFGGTPKSPRPTRRSAVSENFDPSNGLPNRETTPVTPAASQAPPSSVSDAKHASAEAATEPPRDRLTFLKQRRALLDELQRLQKSGLAPQDPAILQVRRQITALYTHLDPHRAKRRIA